MTILSRIEKGYFYRETSVINNNCLDRITGISQPFFSDKGLQDFDVKLQFLYEVYSIYCKYEVFYEINQMAWKIKAEAKF